MSEWSRDSEYKVHSNGLTLGQLGHNERTVIVPVQPINQISKRAAKKLMKQTTAAAPNPYKSGKRNKKIRAEIVKRTFPDMKNVPNSLSKKQRAILIKSYKGSRTSQPEGEQELLSLGGFASKGSRIVSLPEVTEERRKEVARTLGGLSNSDPILID